MKIYLASSWRNTQHPSLVQFLRAIGHEVYDFKNPRPGDDGFSWAQIDPAWQTWSPEQFREALDHPIAKAGFTSDMEALIQCDACVLLLPCGRSAHLELGFAVGARKATFVVLADGQEPELMYRMCSELCLNQFELADKLVRYQGHLDTLPPFDPDQPVVDEVAAQEELGQLRSWR